MSPHDETALFEELRPTLLGLAYRMLGSRADAEDAVQDTFLKWKQADKGDIDNPSAWLTSACTRRCIDLARSAHRSRVDYVGPWLPEPVHTPTEGGAEEALVLASSLTTAFLLMLERLTPKERAAYLLHEVFDVSYPETARTLAIEEAACRKLISRARASIDQAKVRHVTPVERQEQLLAAFKDAVVGGSTEQLAALLSDDIELRADGGGKVPTLLQVLHGKAEVLEYLEQKLRQYWDGYQWTVADLNGGRGLVLRKGGHTVATASFAYDEAGRTTDIYIIRNPDKLTGLDGVAALQEH
ncbi:RNA polymerase sigma factor SigJ [Pyxidicoccus parkwayensis]|uniref:RNA polymerase sigma factor SigJ n=1 Tax=Pyxidicoccus parkwayensis TaxID=2813578 RepID=A0ABX7NQ28_9BACT|nr:RNA polymerase sigma factor SigJ [Pyxidicoccus parkwaysis]QSQ19501.1 RNA polymerase sigma factor SigJ [Pyxidicoccus parkwaysis]